MVSRSSKKKKSKNIPGYKILMLIFNLIGKEVIFTVTLDLTNFCKDWHSNDVFNLHLVAVIIFFNTLQKQTNKCSKFTIYKSLWGLSRFGIMN